jgi:hypothetical protein
MKLLNLLLFTALPSLDATAVTTLKNQPTATNFVETVAVIIPNTAADDRETSKTFNGSISQSSNIESQLKNNLNLEQLDNWNNLKIVSTLYAAVMGWTLYSYYSQYFGIAEMWQSKGPRNSAASGYPDVSIYCFPAVSTLTVGTINLALKYFKLNWLTPELTIARLI